MGFKSGVQEQPVGKEQTEEGAQYRADKAKELKPDCDCWIGIENGMYREVPKEINDNNNNNKKVTVFDYWFDIGCIVIIYKDPTNDNKLKTDVIWSDSLAIPVENCRECLTNDGKQAKYNGNYTWSPLKDPHEKLTNGKKPRKIWLLEAMQKWKAQSIFK